MWCHTEELQTKMAIIHTLENRLSVLREQYEAEVQRNERKVHTYRQAHVLERVKQLCRNKLMMHNMKSKLYLFNMQLCQSPQLKQEFSGELAGLEEALNHERKHIHEEMKRLREELQEKHKTELSALRTELDTEMEEERSSLKKAFDEEKEKLKSVQAALDNQESKTS